jgi:hypothetical protein
MSGDTKNHTKPAHCGFSHDRGAPNIKPKSYYSLLGWFTILWGISVRPKKVSYICEHCLMVVNEDLDPKGPVF